MCQCAMSIRSSKRSLTNHGQSSQAGLDITINLNTLGLRREVTAKTDRTSHKNSCTEQLGRSTGYARHSSLVLAEDARASTGAGHGYNGVENVMPSMVVDRADANDVEKNETLLDHGRGRAIGPLSLGVPL